MRKIQNVIVAASLFLLVSASVVADSEVSNRSLVCTSDDGSLSHTFPADGPATWQGGGWQSSSTWEDLEIVIYRVLNEIKDGKLFTMVTDTYIINRFDLSYKNLFQVIANKDNQPVNEPIKIFGGQCKVLDRAI